MDAKIVMFSWFDSTGQLNDLRKPQTALTSPTAQRQYFQFLSFFKTLLMPLTPGLQIHPRTVAADKNAV